MFERILVPLDGSPFSEAVLPHVRALARGRECEILLMRAVNPIPVDGYLPVYDVSIERANEGLSLVASRLADEGFRARPLSFIGSVAPTIVDAAALEKATLIAMATHGRTGVARFLLGSVTESVLGSSPVPVLAVRASDERPIRIVLVPLYRSEASTGALPHAEEFARETGARLLLLHALPPRLGREWEGAAEAFSDRRPAEDWLESLADPMRDRGLEVATRVDEGPAARVILDAAREEEADLVAMAWKGRRGLGRLLHASVTRQVLRAAPWPVLVTPVPKHAPVAKPV